ncbi:MAG: IS110 family transposase [Eubacterium sp.]|nr:IS110 family transposase [Eubacterium sp.]
MLRLERLLFAQTLLEAAQNSVGLEAGEAARLEIWVLVNDYILKAEQLKRLDEYLEEKVREVANVEKLLAIKGVGMSTVIGFIAEVGDIGRFTDPKQIQKLAGLKFVKKSSGKKRGQPRISKRGSKKLRRTMYESARVLMQWNPAFREVFPYYRNRKTLGGMQAR